MAMITKATNNLSSMRPFSKAINPNIISMAPLAFIPKPTARDSLKLNPPWAAPKPLPIIFPANEIAKIASVRPKSKLVTKFIFSPMDTKNKGAKMLLINWWTISLALSDICSESPKAIPNKKAPKNARKPQQPRNPTAKKQKAQDKKQTPPGQASFLLNQSKTLLIIAFPTLNIKKGNPKVIPKGWIKDRLLPRPLKDQ